ncbi:hypothetical protein WG78_20200 [Amantichitinum ursilacus]|uniref:DUF2946 domain-containing protein n=2 Tax=Amantichitinum ursilacus TaxID=857265 RepID=A0A0N0XGD7_9NEIS|nr:hypothetical protein WG78_20200 [Amantichitinum ursilacus]
MVSCGAMKKRLYSKAVLIALCVALLNFALPLVHMAATNAVRHQLVLCSGNGVQIVFTADATPQDTHDGSSHSTASLQPCALCAHTAQAALPSPAAPALAPVHYVPIARVAAPPAPVDKAYAFEYPRGRAPPLA